MKHSRCWNATSRLRTSREEGAGLGQITRAFKPDGSIRFDALQELKAKHPKPLQELSWSTVYTRPDLQIRAVVLKIRDNITYYEPYSKTYDDALAFADASYNGGVGGLDRERRACKTDPACDHTRWFDNVEKYCLKSKAVLYGNRSACDINRHHVVDVLKTRSNKYIQFFPIKQETIWPVQKEPIPVIPILYLPAADKSPVTQSQLIPENVEETWWKKLLKLLGSGK